MLAVDSPQPALNKQSILRRFSRQDRRETALASYDELVRSPRKLQRRARDLRNSPLPTSRFDSVKVEIAKPLLLPPPIAAPVQKVDIPATTRHSSDSSSRRRSSASSEASSMDWGERSPSLSSEKSSPDSSAHCPLIPLRVLPNAMPAKPFSSKPQISPWNVFLPPSQVWSLYLGCLPKEWTDRWFVYSEGPDSQGKLKIHFHRSWTGLKIAELFVVMDVKGEGAGKVVGIKWNAGADTNRMNEEEAKYMIRTCCQWSLGVSLEQGE